MCVEAEVTHSFCCAVPEERRQVHGADGRRQEGIDGVYVIEEFRCGVVPDRERQTLMFLLSYINKAEGKLVYI